MDAKHLTLPVDNYNTVMLALQHLAAAVQNTQALIQAQAAPPAEESTAEMYRRMAEAAQQTAP